MDAVHVAAECCAEKALRLVWVVQEPDLQRDQAVWTKVDDLTCAATLEIVSERRSGRLHIDKRQCTRHVSCATCLCSLVVQDQMCSRLPYLSPCGGNAARCEP